MRGQCVSFLSISFIPFVRSFLTFPWEKGFPTPKIEWTRDGAPIVRTHGQVVYRKWAIILEDLTQKDSGAYTCTVCNLHGCANHTTQLRVQGKYISHSHSHSHLYSNEGR